MYVEISLFYYPKKSIRDLSDSVFRLTYLSLEIVSNDNVN
jgi:hypothetical protein